MNEPNLTPGARAVMHSAARELAKLAWTYVVAIRVARIENDRETGWNTGTGVLLRLGNSYAVATAWHVFAEYLTRQGRGEDVVLLVDNAPLYPPEVTFADEDNDVVLLRVPAEHLSRIDAVPYDPGAKWPPRRVTTDDVVIFCGLPAYLRVEDGSGELLFGNLTLCLTVTSASETRFVLQLDREEWEDLGRLPLPGADVPLGGISGAPVFVMDDLSYPLVGLVSEIGETLPLLYVSSLSGIPAS